MNYNAIQSPLISDYSSKCIGSWDSANPSYHSSPPPTQHQYHHEPSQIGYPASYSQ